MPGERNEQDLMHYDRMAQEALRGVIKLALRRAAEPGGLPGQHHLYLSFKTQAAGVSVPAELTEKYPDEMTIVLQHQFWDLAPGETFFQVTLKFGGQPKRLSVPYAAVTRFYDPSVQFLLQFEAEDDTPAELGPPAPVTALPEPASKPKTRVRERPAETHEERPPSGDDDGPKIVSLDQFRKK